MFYCHYPIIGRESRFPIYLISIGVHDCQPYTRRGTEYAYPQIFYCTKGSGMLCIDGVKTMIKPGMGFFIPASCPHEYYPVGDVWDNHWIEPGGYACERMLSEIGLDRPRVFTLGSSGRLERIFTDMHDALRHDGMRGNIRASGFLYDLLIELDRVIDKGISSGLTNPAIGKCVELIDAEYRRRITLDELCTVAGLSRQHLCRLFRNVLGARPAEYIAKRRIQAAKELLSGTGMTTEEIAETVGFGSSSYFCKLFKRYEDISPKQFRDNR